MDKPQKQLLFTLLVLFLTITLIVSSLIIKASYQESNANFHNKANVIYQSLTEAALINTVVLESFVSLASNLKLPLEKQRVRHYTEKIQKKYPHIYMFELQQAVKKEDVIKFQNTMRSFDQSSYTLKSFSYDTDRKWQPLPEKPIYYPLTFMAPQLPEAEEVLGLDILSVPFLSRALNESINQQSIFSSKPFELAEGGRAYILFQAIPNTESIASLVISIKALLSYINKINLDTDIILQYPDYHGEWITESTNENEVTKSFFGHYIVEYKFNNFGQPFTLVIQKPVTLADLNIGLTLTLDIIIFAIFILIYQLTRKVIKSKHLLDNKNLELQTLIKSKQNLFANISHELRTPLTLISSPLEQLIDASNLTSKQNKLLKMANNNSKRLFKLVEKILNLTSTNKKEKSLENIVIDDQIVKYIIAFEPLLQAKNINLSKSLTSNAVLKADQDDIASIIENLLTNALKYTLCNGWVKLKSSVDNGHYQLIIENSHNGLTNVETDKVFDRFERLGQSDSEQGFGLGLSFVKDICQENNWKIECNSTANHSISFILTINDFSILEEQTITPAQRQINELALSKDSKAKTHKQSILIVEDNTELREFLADIFSGEYSVKTAKNGLLGVDTAIDEIPDIIISDVMMPDLDGYQLVEKLTQHDNTCHIPIILLTAKADKESELKGLKLGSIDYITKPFDANSLLSKVRNTLDKKQSLLNSTSTSDRKHNVQYLSERDKNFNEKLNRVVEENYIDSGFSVEQLVDKIAMSERQLQRKLKAVFNQTPAEFIRYYRLLKSKELLLAGKSISNVADLVGFNSSSYFSRSFRSTFNQSPSEFIQDKVTA